MYAGEINISAIGEVAYDMDVSPLIT
jgi:hypothetical protein